MLFFISFKKLVGTDEATTCVGLAIRNRTSGMYEYIKFEDKNLWNCVKLQYLFLKFQLSVSFSNLRTSVAHMDSPKVVDIGLTQMLALVVNQDSKAELDVFFSISSKFCCVKTYLCLLTSTFAWFLISVVVANAGASNWWF